MTTRNLDRLLAPRSIAVVGASARPNRVGSAVWANLRAGGFRGELWPVNPKYDAIDGVRCFPDPHDLPSAPDLAVLCTPLRTVPELVAAFGALGTRAVSVIDGLRGLEPGQVGVLATRMLEAAGPHTLRILGPDSMGLLVPPLGINASVAPCGAIAGRLAFVSQSGTLAAAVLDWAAARDIGFSHVVSMGEAVDVDLGDLVDYLGADAATAAILIHIESLTSARKFMSAARAAARNKPVIVMRSGRSADAARTEDAGDASTVVHADEVYDAAIRRAGMLRVQTTEDLFGAVSILSNARPLAGDRLAVLANAEGPATMAADELLAADLRTARLAEETGKAIEGTLAGRWSRTDPVVLASDASVDQYVGAARALLEEPGADALLAIHAPTPMVPSLDVALALVAERERTRRNVLACFMGGGSVTEARDALARAGVPRYDTPEQAARAFVQLVQFRRNQRALMEVPALLADSADGASRAAAEIVRAALAQQRTRLSEPEAMAVLHAYGVPVAPTRVVRDEGEASAAAAEIGFPVAIKVLGERLGRRAEVGGVVLDIEDDAALSAACAAVRRRVQALAPGARIDGFTVQAMARRPEARELAVGAAVDPAFGPVVFFGQSGQATDDPQGHAVALPPLNQVLARDLVSRSRVASRLEGRGGRCAADQDAIHRVLIAVGQVLADVPQVVSLEIDPLLADHEGALALDVRIRVTGDGGTGVDRFAILPYPQHLEQTLPWRGGQLVVRPIRPEDAPAHLEFFRALDPDDVRARAMAAVSALRPEDVARLTQIDYDREMALIATRRRADGRWETLGVARSYALPDRASAEFAVIVRSDLKGKGLGGILMAMLIAHCRASGIGELRGETFPDNAKMIKMARALGFRTEADRQEGVVRLLLPLRPV